MRMFSSETAIGPRRPAALALSLAAHGALLLAGALLVLHMNRVRPVYTDSRCCTAALYWTGNTAASDVSPGAPRSKLSKLPPVAPPKSSRIENPERLRQPRSAEKQAPAAQKRLAQASAPSQQQQATLGTGAGSEDAEAAYPIYFPSPVVANRALLPAVEQKIIVNVSISAQGGVTDEELVQGLGNSLDQIVLAIVKTWRFHPATLNGTAVASSEQLVFPFNRDYSSTGDGPSNS